MFDYGTQHSENKIVNRFRHAVCWRGMFCSLFIALVPALIVEDVFARSLSVRLRYGVLNLIYLI